MRDAHEHPELGDQFRRFARTAAHDGNTLYEAISLAVADDGDVLSLFDGAAADQRRPMLLLAAVHFLLLGGADHPLARRYRTVAELRGLPPPAVPPSLNGVGEEFADFCAGWRPELVELVGREVIQTNEVGRCTSLLPGLAVAGQRSGRPLRVLDLGASAGLNLLFDRYRYEYTAAGGGGTLEAGPGDSPVVLRCELQGPLLPALSMPEVAVRSGLDLRPVDPTDPERARWLLACQWPDDLERFRRLRAALSLAASLPPGERPSVAAGDMVSAVPAVAAAAPRDTALCVLHTWVAAYLTPEEQAALCQSMLEASEVRPVYWLFVESPFEVPSLPQVPPPGGEVPRSFSALMLVELDRGEQVVHRLADVHHHGRWMQWHGVGR